MNKNSEKDHIEATINNMMLRMDGLQSDAFRYKGYQKQFKVKNFN